MYNDSMKIVFQVDAIQKSIEECDMMSFRMKGASILCLLVDVTCAKKGDFLIILLTFSALFVFYCVIAVLMLAWLFRIR